MKKFLPALFLSAVVLLFFWKFILRGLLPIPADTIVGLYYPYRDFFAKDYPRGIPFFNFQITDPVRQQYSWKNLTISAEKKLELPLWNPYTFSGSPLLANFQSAAFYPFNLLYFFLPFSLSWSILILLQPILGSFFLYLFLRNLSVGKIASIIGATTFAFSGFSISWLEWGNIISTGLWLPLILLSLDKVFLHLKDYKKQVKWLVLMLMALSFSFFSGHLQIFLYVALVSALYFIFRWIENGKPFKIIGYVSIFFLLFLLFTAIQWIPTLQFIFSSARSLDQADWRLAGWFVPWQNIVQFIVPDFFGNPATLNYFGVFNYGEFIGYVGIFPLIMAIFSIFNKSKTTFMFWAILLLALLFAFPTPLAKIPFKLNIPFISTSQPTRLLFIVDFTLSVLAAFGVDYFIKTKNKKLIFIPLCLLLIAISLCWIFISILGSTIEPENLAVIKRNLILPTILFALTAIIFAISFLIKKIYINKSYIKILFLLFTILLIADLFRFGWKYTTFAEKKYLYPTTKTLDFLQKNLGNHRFMSNDSRIFPPNFSAMYKLQSVDGYDPLFLQRYAELVAALERGQPNISPPFGFNRIITPQHTESNLINLLGVKYVLSLTELDKRYFKKVFTEGGTFIYENRRVLPRAFFIKNLHSVGSKQAAIDTLFNLQEDLNTSAVVETNKPLQPQWSWLGSSVKIVSYSENRVKIKTENSGDGFLILTDSYYPTWHVKIDDNDSQIYLSDYNFRGVIVPKGEHTVTFINKFF